MPAGAANPWQVVSETPAPSTPPQNDPWKVVSETPATAQPQQGGGAGSLIDRFAPDESQASNPVANALLRGGLKSAASGLGGLVHLAHWITAPHQEDFQLRYLAEHPAAKPEEIQNAWQQQQQANTADHLQKAGDWLREGTEPKGIAENIGAIGEQVLEYLSGERLLGLAGRAGAAAEGAQTVGRGAMATNRLKNAQELASTLAKNPKAAGYLAVGIRAVQSAAGVGAQTMLHTEDPEQAQHAAELGGGTEVALEPLAAAGRYLMRNAPQYVERLGQKFPVLASQLNKEGKITQGNVATMAPGVHGEQQQALPGMVQNLAHRATSNAIEAINAGRPVYKATEETARMLPAPEGAQPMTFSLDMGPTQEGREGSLTTNAEQIPRTHTSLTPENRGNVPTEYSREGGEPEYVQPAGPGGAWSERTGRSWAERRAPGYMHPSGEVEGQADVATGGGRWQTTDPRDAIKMRGQLERGMEATENELAALREKQGGAGFEKLPQSERDAINKRVDQLNAVRERGTQNLKTLNDQLDMYYNSPYAQRFGPEDLEGMLKQTADFGEAQDQLEHAAKPVYSVLDQASGGEFTKFNNQYKQAQKVLSRPATIEAADAAQARMEEAERNINGLIDRHRDQISHDDYMAAKNTWRRAARLGDLHSLVEGMMNGITGEESAMGHERVMVSGSAKNFEKYLAKGTNRAQVEELIGKDGIADLKETVGMFSSAQNKRAMARVGKNVAEYMLKQGWIGKGIGGTVGAGVGAAAGYFFGIPGGGYAGSLAGMTAVEGLRNILRYSTVNPNVGRMLRYAASHDIDPRIYAPLISRAIREPFDEQKKPETGQAQPATAGDRQ
jgi:hypothetical protein